MQISEGGEGGSRLLGAKMHSGKLLFNALLVFIILIKVIPDLQILTDNIRDDKVMLNFGDLIYYLVI